MKRIAAVVACLLVFSAACSRSEHAAATVNGTAITDQEVVDELHAIAGNTDYLSLVEDNLKSSQRRVRGDTEGSFDAAFVAQILQGRIGYELVHQEILRRNVQVDDACRNAALQDVYGRVGNQDVDKGKQIYAKFPQPFQDTLLQRSSDVLALSAALIDLPCQPADAAKAYFDAHPNEFATTCLVIMSVDPTRSDAVIAQLKAGADFATVAQAAATDNKTQDLGCVSLQGFTPAVASNLSATPVGQVAAPIDNGSTVVIAKVTDRKPAVFDDVRSQAQELVFTAYSNSISNWYENALQGATIVVDPRYGTWNAKQGSVDPPAGPATTTTTTSLPTAN